MQPATPGTDLVTTLDRSVQYQAEQVLVRQVGVTGAMGGQIIVMDTDTGDVIAMVSVDRNEQGVPVVSGGNFAAVGAYEPGSVGKVITVAAALEEGAVTPDTMFGYIPWEYDCTRDEGGVLHDSHPARPLVADDRRDPRRVVERRHDPRQQDDPLLAARSLPARVRPRRAHRPRLPGRIGRHPQAVERLDRDGALHRGVRPGRGVDADPAGQRRQRDRQ